MAQHVLKFGNWDGDNVPYTAYFENGRKEKAEGIRIKPNDPHENPEAFNMEAAPPSGKQNRFHKRKTSDQLKRGTYKSTSSTSGSDKTTSHDGSVNSILKPRHQRGRSDRSQISRVAYADDHGQSCGSMAVTKFWEWDEKNPRLAEGFTVIFYKVKEEKQIAAAKFSSVTLSVQQGVNKYHKFSQKEELQFKHI